MSWRIKKLLKLLSDKQWHLTFPKGIGTNTINLCMDQGLVRTRKVNKHRARLLGGVIESYEIELHITSEGTKTLKSASQKK